MLMFCLFVAGFVFTILGLVNAKQDKSDLTSCLLYVAAAVAFVFISILQLSRGEVILGLVNLFTIFCLVYSSVASYNLYKLEKAYPLKNRVKS